MRVYIAGPYTNGDIAVNVRNAILAGQAVLERGHTPYVPHLIHFWHLLCPGPRQQWIDLDLAWLQVCEGVLRLPGESVGADLEVKRASELGIPIYASLDDLPR